MHPIIDPKLLERLRVGPLAPYLDPYVARIERDGFAPFSVPCQAYAIARFSRWLQQGGVRLEVVDESAVGRFLNRDPGVVHYHEPATIRRLVLMLREIGVLSAATPQPLTPIQECVKEYRHYLVQRRGLSLAGLPNYLSYVEQFLSERFAKAEPRLTELSASDVTGFVKSQAAKLSPGRAKLLVTALSAFLRYLLHQGKISVVIFCRTKIVAARALCHKFLLTRIKIAQSDGGTTPFRLGLRADAIVQLNLEDLDWENGIIRIRGKAVAGHNSPCRPKSASPLRLTFNRTVRVAPLGGYF